MGRAARLGALRGAAGGGPDRQPLCGPPGAAGGGLTAGHAVVFGASGWGKTTFIRTLWSAWPPRTRPASCPRLHARPRRAQPGRARRPAARRRGDNPDEEGYKERVEQSCASSRAWSGGARSCQQASVRRPVPVQPAHPEAPLPAIVVAIDNFAEFNETFGGEPRQRRDACWISSSPLPASASPTACTSSSPPASPACCQPAFQRLRPAVYAQAGRSDRVSGDLGVSVADIPNIPGRGYVAVDRVALSFQVALPVDLQYPDRIETRRPLPRQRPARLRLRAHPAANRSPRIPRSSGWPPICGCVCRTRPASCR